ncbi:hypothetical protein P7C71_g3982, partial [Lecanoromycetidae sp. Uapishka_2]
AMPTGAGFAGEDGVEGFEELEEEEGEEGESEDGGGVVGHGETYAMEPMEFGERADTDSSQKLWRIIYSSSGRFHRAIDKQHKRYGAVFRVSPNELSFATPQAWKAIYGHQPAGKDQPVKSHFYDLYGSGYKRLCIGSEQDPNVHRRMKRDLTAAFSTKALLEQEGLISNCVDRFVSKIGEPAEPLNMTKWFEMISFDILGEMAFGESFGAVENGEPHFWSEMIVSHLYFITILDNLARYPLFLTIGKSILPWATTAVRDKHSGYTRKQVERRLGTNSARKDFLSTLVKKVEGGEVDKEEMTAHVSTLVIAGGETTSTFLAATTYYLLQTPNVYARFQAEIRNAFNSYDDITAAAVQGLPYVQAVISEGLRMYPPGSQGFPRLSPSAGTDVAGCWVPQGTEMYVSAWSVTHDENNFHEPFTFKPERWLDPDFAYVEINLILAKMHYKYDLELVDPELDWEGQSTVHVMWSKPELLVRIKPKAA